MQHQGLSGWQSGSVPQLAVGAELVETHGCQVAVMHFPKRIEKDIGITSLPQELVGETFYCFMKILHRPPHRLFDQIYIRKLRY